MHLYPGLAAFSQLNTDFAAKHGYVECAFGLRLRTPILAQTVLNSKTTPYEAESEGRSASNAVTQSWGMLSNRAFNELEDRLSRSPYINDIFVTNAIHDAIYYVFRRDPAVIKWLNDNLIECMEWNAHPRIYSENVPLTANLDVGKSWDKQHELPNKASIEEIEQFLIYKGI